MKLQCTLKNRNYQFHSIKEVLAKASERKSGDILAGISAESGQERVAAKRVLSELTISDIRNNPVVPYEMDAITRIIQDDIDESVYKKIAGWTMAQLRDWILDDRTSGDQILQVGRGISSEVIAGVAKLMGNMDLIYAGNKFHITACCNTTIGEDGVLASRLQPNHPIDDLKGIAASIFEGLSYGIGDAVIGLNPAIDTVESTVAVWNLLRDIKETYEIPTQTCVLSHITTQMKALQTGAKADLCFQSIAGSEKACCDFGITTQILEEARQMFWEEGLAKGKNVMYFETGQGSELSAAANYGADQGVMENRCYGLARHYDPFLVNTVVGFIGPEYVYDTKELIRAALEDVFCGHMHGLPMGCDVCYTNHMKADQNDVESLAVLLTTAGCHYIMGLPQGDDVMLMYQSTGFHDIAAIRQLLHKRPISEFEQWLENRGIWKENHLSENAGNSALFDRIDLGGIRKIHEIYNYRRATERNTSTYWNRP